MKLYDGDDTFGRWSRLWEEQHDRAGNGATHAFPLSQRDRRLLTSCCKAWGALRPLSFSPSRGGECELGSPEGSTACVSCKRGGLRVQHGRAEGGWKCGARG